MKNVAGCLFLAITVFVGTSCKTTNTTITSSVKTPKNSTVDVQQKKILFFKTAQLVLAINFLLPV